MYKKNVFLLLLLLQSIIIKSQSFSLSPYSKFGIGDLSYPTFQPSLGMGYACIAASSNRYINEINPASASNIDTLTFLTDINIIGRSHTLKNYMSKKTTTNTDIAYFAFAFPIMKNLGTQIGLTPISNVGYNIKDTKSIDTLTYQNTYKGDGGFNKVFLNIGYNVISINKTKQPTNTVKINYIHKISLGIQSNYIFGSLDKNSSSVFLNETNIFDLYKTERLIASDVLFKAGILYQFNKIKSDQEFKHSPFRFSIGLIFEKSSPINAKQTILVTKYLNLAGYVTKDTLVNQINKKGTIVMPNSFGIGVSLTIYEKLTWNTDIRHQEWSKVKFFNENQQLRNTWFIGSGIEYIPDPYKFYNYWEMVNYRFGGYYHQTYLTINQTPINEFGINFGIGLPITRTNKGESTMIRRKLPPMINLAFSYGSRGSLNNNMIKEHFYQFSIALNLYDIWFVKRKFN